MASWTGGSSTGGGGWSWGGWGDDPDEDEEADYESSRVSVMHFNWNHMLLLHAETSDQSA